MNWWAVPFQPFLSSTSCPKTPLSTTVTPEHRWKPQVPPNPDTAHFCPTPLMGGPPWSLGRGSALLCIVPTWCIQPRLKLRVEEVPDDGPIIFILGQPAATGERHAFSERWGVHLYPVYKPAWSLAWKEGGTEPIRTSTQTVSCG